MRHHTGIIIFAACALMGACANAGPHNDVLIFGTDTRLALDVSTPVASGGTPEITIGYKRREAVWMPMIVNGAGNDAQLPPAQRQLYQGAVTEGAQTRRTDAYSVFASFGANLRGSRGGAQTEAAAGLAQFFATGIAAQHLGQNSRVAEALAIQPAAAAVANANAAAAAREAALLGRLRQEAGAEAVDAAAQRGRENAQVEEIAAARIELCATRNAPAFMTLLDQLIADANAAADVKTLAGGLKAAANAEARREVIRGRPDAASFIALRCSTEAANG